MLYIIKLGFGILNTIFFDIFDKNALMEQNLTFFFLAKDFSFCFSNHYII